MLFAFDFVPDTNVPLINSGGKIELTPIGQQSFTINIPTTSQTTSDGFWIMGKNLSFFTITNNYRKRLLFLQWHDEIVTFIFNQSDCSKDK